MTDLETLATWCQAKAADPHCPPSEATLWGQIAGEVSAYLTEGDVGQDDLFEPTP